MGLFYNIRPIKAVYLDACLTGLGGIYCNQCYALPLSRNFNDYTIVHLWMFKILVDLKIWAFQWADCKVRINVTIWR